MVGVLLAGRVVEGGVEGGALLDRVDVRAGDPAQAPVGEGLVDQAVVGERGDDEAGELLEGVVVVERDVEDGADVGEEGVLPLGGLGLAPGAPLQVEEGVGGALGVAAGGLGAPPPELARGGRGDVGQRLVLAHGVAARAEDHQAAQPLAPRVAVEGEGGEGAEGAPAAGAVGEAGGVRVADAVGAGHGVAADLVGQHRGGGGAGEGARQAAEAVENVAAGREGGGGAGGGGEGARGSAVGHRRRGGGAGGRRPRRRAAGGEPKKISAVWPLGNGCGRPRYGAAGSGPTYPAAQAPSRSATTRGQRAGAPCSIGAIRLSTWPRVSPCSRQVPPAP